VTSRRDSRGSGRRTRVSRIPALTVLLLMIVIVLAVILAFGYSPTRPANAAGSFGVGVGLSLGREEKGFSEAELEALSSPLPADAASVHVPVLMYHYVDDEPPPAGEYADSLTVRTPDFVDEMDYLVENGYQTVTLADAYLAMAGLKVLPEKAVALTFDDGGLDNYTVAFPILAERGFTGTFFVITKTVGAQGQMDWDQLREMADAGMAIQSHSYSHPGLPGVSDERLRSELVDSRETIAQQIGQPVYVFCYPSGEYDERVIEATRDAGYVMAVATDDGESLGPQSVFEITRTRIQPYVALASFAKYVK
jgi:peptidoglycan/xylan/chitin deacetylase (PgdA/CDA1 family)